MRFFSTFIGAFYSVETYRHARRQTGYMLGYSFFIVTLTTLILTLYFSRSFYDSVFLPQDGKPALVDNVVDQIVAQMPVMTLQQGQLATQEPRIYTITVHTDIRGKHEDTPLITIDTTGETTYETMQTPVLFTAHDFITQGKKEVKIRSLKSFSAMLNADHGALVINHAVAQNLGEQAIEAIHRCILPFGLILGTFFWIVFTLVLYVLRLGTLLVLGFGGKLLGWNLHDKADFAACMRLAAVSYTPVAMFDMAVQMVMHHDHGVRWVWLLLGGCVMLVAALWVTRDTPLAESA